MGPWLIDVSERSEMEAWLHGGPPEFHGSAIMIVRGDDSDIRVFLPNALDAAKLDEGRVVVWVKDTDLLADHESDFLFGDEPAVIAAVVGEPGHVGGWITRDRLRVEDAEFAFVGAEAQSG